MEFLRKNIFKIMVTSFLVAVLLPLIITASITDIYSCVNKADAAQSCAALDSAHWKIQLGLILQMASWGIFIGSLVAYITFKLQNKNKALKK